MQTCCSIFTAAGRFQLQLTRRVDHTSNGGNRHIFGCWKSGVPILLPKKMSSSGFPKYLPIVWPRWWIWRATKDTIVSTLASLLGRRSYSCVLYEDPRLRLESYFSMPVWPASISISILQLSVLAYSATLITYLLEVGYSLLAVTIARASGSLMALLGTFVLPIAANYLRRRYTRIQRTNDAEIEGRVVRRLGLWGVSSQLFLLWYVNLSH